MGGVDESRGFMTPVCTSSCMASGANLDQQLSCFVIITVIIIMIIASKLLSLLLVVAVAINVYTQCHHRFLFLLFISHDNC